MESKILFSLNKRTSSNKRRASNKRRIFGYPYWNKHLPLISASPLISTAPLNTALIRLYVIIMSRTSFRVNPHFIVCLNVKELLARGRHHIWSLSDSNEIQSTHNHLVRKRTFNYELSGCGFESRCCHLNLVEYILLVAKPKCIWN